MSNSFDSTIRVTGVWVSFAFLLTLAACSKPAEPPKQESSLPQTDTQLADTTPTHPEEPDVDQSVRPTTDAGKQEQQPESLTHKQIIQRAGQAVVYLIAKNALREEVASGTGFLIDERGWVATNYHVMRQAATTTGQTRDGTTIEISGLLAADPDHDLVILKLAEVPGTLQPVQLTDPPEIEQGDPVTAVGHPAGFRFTATDGIVSAVRTTKELPPLFAQTLGSDPDTVWIQTSAAISGGNSGGPLFNNLGQVLGVNTWIAPGENLGFAVHVQHLIDLQGDVAAEPDPLPIAGLGIITDRAVAALWRDFNREYEVFMRAFQAATSEKAQQAIYKEQWPVPRYGTRFLDLAKANPGSTTSLQALIGACKLLQESQTAAERELLVGAVELLRKHHLSDRGISEAAINLLPAPEDEVAGLLTAILEESPHRSVRGIACFALASNLKARNQLRASRTLSMLGDAQPEYVALLELATNEYGDVRLRGSTLKKMLESSLTSSKVQTGMVAPEIEGRDLHGQPLRLSDHRGKVIMLDFWADWCPYCRQMYPHNRKLLEKYGDQPFALLGINADEAGRGRQVTDAGQVTWPSWDDGPTHDICTDWAVDGYPTIFLIDQRGIIRFKLSTTDFETLDALVDNLLRDESVKLAEDIVPSEDEWKYLAEDRDPGATWYQPDFDDVSWNTGKAPFGFGHDETTTLDHAELGKNARMTFYFRKSFEIPDPTALKDVVLAAHFDDGVVMFLNGKEVMRRHVRPDARHGEAAYRDRAGQGKYASHLLIDPQLLKTGTNVIAAAVHQASPWSADLRFDASISSNSVARLDELISSDETTARSAAIRIAGDLGAPAELLIPNLKPLLSDSNQNVRMQAYSSLMTIAPDKSDEFKLPVAFSFRDRLTRQQYASNLNAKCWEMVCLPGRSLDDYRRAYKLALIAQALQPNSGPIKNTLAMALVRLGNHKEALTRLAEARKIHGIRPGDYFVAAVAYRQTGKNDRAQEVFDKARELMQEAQDKEKQTESLRDLRMLEREVAQLLENR